VTATGVDTRRPASPGPAGSASHVPVLALSVALGASLLPLVGTGGSPLWRVLRVALVVALTAAAAWWLHRAHRMGSRMGFGSIAVAAGLVGVVTGAGIGVPHAVKGGVPAAAVAGLGALALGVALLVTGAAAMIGATPGWWRLTALPVAFVLVQFGVIPLTAAVYATNVPATSLGAVTPADRGLAYQDVTLVAADGVRLSAWYVPSTNRAAVMLLHGAGSTRSAVLDHAVVLAAAGYGVLLPDARGHGRSGGVAMDWGWYGQTDIAAAASYLANRPEIDPARIGAVGLSMGAEQAITAAAADERIRAVVAEGTGVRTRADLAAFPHDAAGWITRIEGLVMFPVADVLTAARPPVALRDAVADLDPRPLLLIAGRGEMTVNRHYRDASPSAVQLWELPDTAHTDGLATHPDEWRATVLDFLATALPE
jgi:dienelactone hydrolase